MLSLDFGRKEVPGAADSVVAWGILYMAVIFAVVMLLANLFYNLSLRSSTETKRRTADINKIATKINADQLNYNASSKYIFEDRISKQVLADGKRTDSLYSTGHMYKGPYGISTRNLRVNPIEEVVVKASEVDSNEKIVTEASKLKPTEKVTVKTDKVIKTKTVVANAGDVKPGERVTVKPSQVKPNQQVLKQDRVTGQSALVKKEDVDLNDIVVADSSQVEQDEKVVVQASQLKPNKDVVVDATDVVPNEKVVVSAKQIKPDEEVVAQRRQTKALKDAVPKDSGIEVDVPPPVNIENRIATRFGGTGEYSSSVEFRPKMRMGGQAYSTISNRFGLPAAFTPQSARAI